MKLNEGVGIAEGLLAFVPLVEPGVLRNLVNGKGPVASVATSKDRWTNQRLFASRLNSDRIGTHFGASGYASFACPFSSATKLTLAGGNLGCPANATYPLSLGQTSGTDYSGLSWFMSTGGVCRFGSTISTGTTTSFIAGEILNGVAPWPFRFVLTQYDDTNRALFWEGKQKSTQSVQRTMITPVALSIGARWISGAWAQAGANQCYEFAAAWDRALADAEAYQFNENPWILVTRDTRRVYSAAAGGGTQTRTVTASGGISFAGAATLERQRILSAAGGLAFSGAGIAARARTSAPSGGVVFGGAADYSTETGAGTQTREVVSTGGLTLGGAATLTRERVSAAAGGVSFSGLSTIARVRDVTGSGGVVFAGAATLARYRVAQGTGGLVFSGSAPYSTHESTRTVVASGGIVLGGAAQASFPSVAVTNFIAGTAVAADGMMQTIYLSDGVTVPSDRVMVNGIAHSLQGSRYICSWPTIQGVTYNAGRAVRADGALVCAIEMTVAGHYSGFGLSYRGESYISLSTEGKFKDGLGIRTAGQLPVSDNS
jgi:hypothetical protein